MAYAFIAALMVTVVGGGLLIISAFRTGAYWGLLSLIPGGVFVFAMFNWGRAKMPVLVWGVGFVAACFFGINLDKDAQRPETSSPTALSATPSATIEAAPNKSGDKEDPGPSVPSPARTAKIRDSAPVVEKLSHPSLTGVSATIEDVLSAATKGATAWNASAYLVRVAATQVVRGKVATAQAGKMFAEFRTSDGQEAGYQATFTYDQTGLSRTVKTVSGAAARAELPRCAPAKAYALAASVAADRAVALNLSYLLDPARGREVWRAQRPASNLAVIVDGSSCEILAR